MTPKWAIKYIHKSKRYAVKIINQEDHREVADVPGVFDWSDGPTEGKKAAQLIVAAPELLAVAEQAEMVYGLWKNHFPNDITLDPFIQSAREAIDRATC